MVDDESPVCVHCGYTESRHFAGKCPAYTVKQTTFELVKREPFTWGEQQAEGTVGMAMLCAARRAEYHSPEGLYNIAQGYLSTATPLERDLAAALYVERQEHGYTQHRLSVLSRKFEPEKWTGR